MKFTIEKMFDASVKFEYSVEINDQSYLVIYGHHVNGSYCCIPNYGWGCEMSDPESVSYNTDKLIKCGADEEVAKEIAKSILHISEEKS